MAFAGVEVLNAYVLCRVVAWCFGPHSAAVYLGATLLRSSPKIRITISMQAGIPPMPHYQIVRCAALELSSPVICP